MGAVYVYKKASNDTGLYALTQTLTSSAKEVSENFGYALSFSGDILAVTSPKGDMTIETTFDNGTTNFDNQMTSLQKLYKIQVQFIRMKNLMTLYYMQKNSLMLIQAYSSLSQFTCKCKSCLCWNVQFTINK